MTDQDVITRFHEMIYYSPGGWQGSKWLGITTQQNPNDIWIIQEIISEVRPDFLVETGTWRGGSAALWATVLRQVNPTGRVITLDFEDNTDPAVHDLPIVKEAVDFVIGQSVDPTTFEEINRRTRNGLVMVLLDSNHCAHYVVQELDLYSTLVNVNSYIVVQDTNLNGHPVFPGWGAGPWEALDEWLPKHPEFESDRSRERLMLTMHPRGYLKRVS